MKFAQTFIVGAIAVAELSQAISVEQRGGRGSGECREICDYYKQCSRDIIATADSVKADNELDLEAIFAAGVNFDARILEVKDLKRDLWKEMQAQIVGT